MVVVWVVVEQSNPPQPISKMLSSVVVKPGKNSFFLKNGKTVILVENHKFSRSRMMEWTSPLNSSREI